MLSTVKLHRHQAAALGSGLVSGLALLACVAAPNSTAPPPDEVDPSTHDPTPAPQLSEADAQARLQARCLAECRTIIDRDVIVRRLVYAATFAPPPSSTAQDKAAIAQDKAAAVSQRPNAEAGFRRFVAGGPAVLVWIDYLFLINPDEVDLDGRRGLALYLNAEDRVTACVASDPKLLPTAVRVECEAGDEAVSEGAPRGDAQASDHGIE